MKPKLLLTALTMASLAHATALLTLSPSSGSIVGTPGSEVGWGFTLSNPTNFAVISSSSFCLGSSGVTNLCAESTLGTYSDIIGPSFIIVGPAPESPIVTQPFNLVSLTGVGSFLIDANSPMGAINTGQLILTYDLFNVDPDSPAFDPNADLISTGNFLSAAASITVGTPEPATWALIGLAGISALGIKRFRIRYARS